MADTRRTRRARRGRPAKTDPPPTETGSRLAGEVEALANAEEEHGWVVLATTVRAEAGAEAAMLQTAHDHNTPVAPGLRWSKNPAAISPVWLEQPERLAALALLTVMGLLVSTVIPRQVRLSLRTHDQQIPGHTGMTAPPTAAVVVALFAHVALIQCVIDAHEIEQISGVQPHHLRLCDALGLDSSWSAVPSAQKNGRGIQTP